MFTVKRTVPGDKPTELPPLASAAPSCPKTVALPKPSSARNVVAEARQELAGRELAKTTAPTSGQKDLAHGGAKLDESPAMLRFAHRTPSAATTRGRSAIRKSRIPVRRDDSASSAASRRTSSSAARKPTRPTAPRTRAGPRTSGQRLRGGGASASRRRRMEFPKLLLPLAPGTMIYGIDASRSSMIASVKRGQSSATNTAAIRARKGLELPLKVNDYNDAWVAKSKGVHTKKYTTAMVARFKDRYTRYEAFIETYPEIREVQPKKHSLHAPSTVRQNDDARRALFGRLSKAGLNFAHLERDHVFYTLDGMDLRKAMVNSEDNPFYGSVSSQEVRHAYANRDVFCPHTAAEDLHKNTIRFVKDGVEVPPPWTDRANARLFRAYDRSRPESPRMMRPVPRPATPDVE